MVTQEDVPVGQVLPGKGRNSLVRGSRTSGVFRLPFTTQHQVTPLSTHRVGSLLLNPKVLQGLRQLSLQDKTTRIRVERRCLSVLG